MASYLDLIPKFREYVPETPPEVVAQVGVYKQQKYEENVQKIQDQIEKVAGLDIIRDIDKKYLQSKLDELGGNLTMFAAGDFSNFQLVNSVSGMTKQIVNDKNIQVAVASTAAYRKQVTAMEKARADGKSSVSNEWDFGSKANKYISSTDLGRSFSDIYTPYTDTKKKAMEAIKALHPKLQSIDIPYEILPDGRINTRKIADAMTRNKVEGITEDQIKQAIYASMTPDDMNQMAIDGRYQFRGVDENMLAEKARMDYVSQRDEAFNSLNYLKDKKKISNNPKDLDKINKQIEYYESLVGKDGKGGELFDQYNINVQNALNNPDEVKFAMYKDGFVKEFANAFSWKNEEKQLLTNPIKQQENFVAEMREKIREFDINKSFEQARLDISRQELGIKYQELGMKQMELSLKKAELYGDPAAADWTPLGDPTTYKNESVQMFANIVSKYGSSLEGNMQTLKNQGYTDDQINVMINDYEKNSNKATSVPPQALGVIQNILKDKNKLLKLDAKRKQLQAEADAEVVEDPKNAAALANADAFAKTIRPLTIEGKTYSPKELGDRLLSGKAHMYVDQSSFGKKIYYEDKEKGIKFTINQHIPIGDLSREERTRRGLTYSGLENVTATNDLWESGLQIIEYNTKKKEVFEKADNLYREKLAPLVVDYIPQIKAVTSGKDGAPPPIVVSRISALATAANFNNIKADSQTNLEDVSKFLSDKYSKDTRIFVKQTGDSYEVMIKNEQEPNNIQTLRLNRGEADVFRYFGDGYTNPRTFESLNLKLGKGNTNVSSDPELGEMQVQFGDFPKINRLQVTADLQQDLSNPDLYFPMINIKKKDGGYTTFSISGRDHMSRLGYDQAKTQLNNLNDNDLLKIIKAQYPDYDISQLDY